MGWGQSPHRIEQNVHRRLYVERKSKASVASRAVPLYFKLLILILILILIWM